MKTFVSTFALALALAFTGPAFAGDVTKAKNAADCEKAGGTWDAATYVCSLKRRCRAVIFAKGARFGGRPFLFARKGSTQ